MSPPFPISWYSMATRRRHGRQRAIRQAVDGSDWQWQCQCQLYVALVLPAASSPSSSILIGLLPNRRFHARFMHDIAAAGERGRREEGGLWYRGGGSTVQRALNGSGLQEGSG